MLRAPVLWSLAASAEAAPCGSWDATLAVAPTSGLESKALTVDWSTPPAPCTNTSGDDWDGTEHLMLRRNAGTTSPTSPTGGTLVTTTTALTHDDIVHRSSKAYAYAVFACEDASCTEWFGDGTGSDETTSNTTGNDETDPEAWSLTDITGESDVTSVVVDDPAATGPHAFFYPDLLVHQLLGPAGALLQHPG